MISFCRRKAGNTFQHLMDQILGYLPFSFEYVDNILIFSKDHSSHIEHLQEVFLLCCEYGLTIGLPKCKFAVSLSETLRHHLCLSTANKQAWSPEVSRNDQFLKEISLWCSQSPGSTHRCSQGSWENHLLVSTRGLCLQQGKGTPLISFLAGSPSVQHINLQPC